MSDKPRLPAAQYALLYPRLSELVMPLGYALALHGTMGRDLDLVAIPWTADAATAEDVARSICDHVGGFTGWDPHPGLERPHGRRCWVIWFRGADGMPLGSDEGYIDLSIMSRHNQGGGP